MDKNTRRHRRNITIINNEFDYDKLAEAIVKAQRKAEESTDKTDVLSKEKLTFKKFWELVKCIVLNKSQSNGTMTSGIFGGLLTAVFNLLAIIGCVVVFFGIIAFIVFCKNLTWSWAIASGNISVIVLFISMLVMILMFALLFRGAANELAIEKDRNYVVSDFSGVVSFAALVVALVALYKGVG